VLQSLWPLQLLTPAQCCNVTFFAVPACAGLVAMVLAKPAAIRAMAVPDIIGSACAFIFITPKIKGLNNAMNP
jgi:hypothetical protein